MKVKRDHRSKFSNLSNWKKCFPSRCTRQIPNIEVLGLRVGQVKGNGRTGPTEKSGPPRKEAGLFGSFSNWTEPIHSVLDRNSGKFWSNGLRSLCCVTGKTLYSHSASLRPAVSMCTREFSAGGNPAMN